MPRIAHPTEAQVDEYHKKYLAALEELYNTHRHKYYKPTDFRGRPMKPSPLKFVE